MADGARSIKHYNRSIEQVVALAGVLPQTAIATLLGETRAFVRYWQQKAADPTFHDGLVGGARNIKFEDAEDTLVLEMLWSEVRRNPRKTSRAYAAILTGRGFECNGRQVLMLQTRQVIPFVIFRWVSRALQRLGFSSKRVKYRNASKFSLANAVYYAQYITGIQFFDWFRLKFLDEVRFAVVFSFSLCLALRSLALILVWELSAAGQRAAGEWRWCSVLNLSALGV